MLIKESWIKKYDQYYMIYNNIYMLNWSYVNELND